MGGIPAATAAVEVGGRLAAEDEAAAAAAAACPDSKCLM